MALMAWIKANPGKFTYCRPEDGGIGDNFVMRAIEDTWTNGDPGPIRHPRRKYWSKAWALLRSIEPSLYKGGFHPNGIFPCSTCWVAAPCGWPRPGPTRACRPSDQGTLPPTIQFTQINCLPSPADLVHVCAAGVRTENAGALAILNFTLPPTAQAKIATAIEGFPGIWFKYLPAKSGPLWRPGQGLHHLAGLTLWRRPRQAVGC